MGMRYDRGLRVTLFGLFSILLTSSIFGQNMFRKVNDFDGDGKADFAVTRNIEGNKYWYIWQTRDGFKVFHWGLDADQNAAGDYDGDGKCDIAIYRQASGGSVTRYQFWIWQSLGGQRVVERLFNSSPNSVALQQDYDGDGKTDVSFTIEDGARAILFRSDGSGSPAMVNPGGAFIRIGDMTGDGKADTAAFNSSSNVVSIKNFATDAIQTTQWGIAGDEFVSADFDGDGKGDLTIFRQSKGQWWWLRSSDNVVNAATFGATGDKPVPADYDGDGKTDLAVWRPGEMQSYYWVYGSLGNVMVIPFGIGTDKVVTY